MARRKEPASDTDEGTQFGRLHRNFGQIDAQKQFDENIKQFFLWFTKFDLA